MHYYKFNIADWYLNTSHLSILEEAVYFRLVNHYYSNEKPFKEEETQSLLRRLRLVNESKTVDLILDEFFTLNNGIWINNRCDKEIKAFKKKSKINKLNGAMGGRPPKNKGVENNPKITQTVNEKNPKITLTTNHKPLTTNHKPIKKNKASKPTELKEALDYSPLNLSSSEVKEVIDIRKKNKGGEFTQRIINGIAEEFKIAKGLGFTNDHILYEWDSRGWKSFKADWMPNAQQVNKINSFKTQNDQSESLNQITDVKDPNHWSKNLGM